jgi:type IV pilus assembly protein PilV
MDAEMKQRHATSRHRHHRGFTLLEVLVSLLVFSFGVLGMVGLQARAVQFSVDAEDRSKAAVIANEVITWMWSQKTLTVPAATITAFETQAQSAGLPANVAIAVPAPVGGVATVTITWKSPSKKAADPSSSYFTQVAM